MIVLVEFTKSRKALGDTRIDDPSDQWPSQQSTWEVILKRLRGDLPDVSGSFYGC